MVGAAADSSPGPSSRTLTRRFSPSQSHWVRIRRTPDWSTMASTRPADNRPGRMGHFAGQGAAVDGGLDELDVDAAEVHERVQVLAEALERGGNGFLHEFRGAVVECAEPHQCLGGDVGGGLPCRVVTQRGRPQRGEQGFEGGGVPVHQFGGHPDPFGRGRPGFNEVRRRRIGHLLADPLGCQRPEVAAASGSAAACWAGSGRGCGSARTRSALLGEDRARTGRGSPPSTASPCQEPVPASSPVSHRAATPGCGPVRRWTRG